MRCPRDSCGFRTTARPTSWQRLWYTWYILYGGYHFTTTVSNQAMSSLPGTRRYVSQARATHQFMPTLPWFL